jgi:hypothetical protein
MSNSLNTVTTESVRSVIKTVLQLLPFDGRESLITQADTVETVSGGSVTDLQLHHRKPIPTSSTPDGPIPVRALVREDGQDIGELLIWVSAGYLSSLEYAWWTDDPPTVLPTPEQIVLLTD